MSKVIVNLSEIKQTLPPIIPRADLPKFNWLYTKGYMANLDSENKGPKKIRIGRKICYHRNDLLEWLGKRCEVLSS